VTPRDRLRPGCEDALAAHAGEGTRILKRIPREQGATLTPTRSLSEGEGAVPIPPPPQRERDRVRGSVALDINGKFQVTRSLVESIYDPIEGDRSSVPQRSP